LHYDALGSWFLVIVAVLGFFGTLYSISYLRREEKRQMISPEKLRRYYALFQFFILTMFVAVGANNVLLLWIAVEATTLCSAFLVNFFDRPAAIEAAWKYMIINTVALLIGLFGVFLFIGAVEHAAIVTISLDWASIAAIAPILDVSLLKLAFVFMLIGYGTKAGLAPLHNWLPDAHSQAPSPVSAMLSGALLNVALLALLRFKGIVDIAAGPSYSQTLLLLFGTASIVIAALLILVQKQYKRLLAYSSVEHIGIIAFGFGVGGAGSVAALLHALYHSLAKSLLFLASGNIILRYHAHEISSVRGLLRTLPLTGALFFAGLLAVAGLPPFGTFLTEFAIFSAAFGAHPWLTAIALAALAIAFVGIMRHISAMCFGSRDESIKSGEDDLLGVVPIVALFALLLVLSIVQPQALVTLLHNASINL
jgi:hydrogenase-4 component F